MIILGSILILVASILFGYERAFVSVWKDNEFVELNAFRKTIIFLIIIFGSSDILVGNRVEV